MSLSHNLEQSKSGLLSPLKKTLKNPKKLLNFFNSPLNDFESLVKNFTLFYSIEDVAQFAGKCGSVLAQGITRQRVYVQRVGLSLEMSGYLF